MSVFDGFAVMLGMIGVVYFTTRWAIDNDRKARKRNKRK